MATSWAPPSPAEKYNAASAAPSSATTELDVVPAPSPADKAATEVWNPENPFFWFAGIAALTVGLMAFSTSVRVGGTTATVAVGDTK